MHSGPPSGSGNLNLSAQNSGEPSPSAVKKETVESPPASTTSSTKQPKTLATITVNPTPSGLTAGPLRPPVIGMRPSRSEQEDARKRLKETFGKRGPRAKVPSNIGVLRMMVVGDSGIGKTSLIRAFLAATEVVDSTSAKVLEKYTTLPICQTQASTIPEHHLYMGEERLNITFLEPPGFGSHTDAMRIIRPVVDFNTAQFQRTDRVFARDKPIPNSTIVKFLNSGTGAHTHTDVCFYVVLHRIKAVDLEFLRQLSPTVTIIPVIAKSDTLKAAEVFALKVSILEELWRAGIEVYGFGLSHSELLQISRAGVSGAVPYAVTTTKTKSSVHEDLTTNGATTPVDEPATINEFDLLKDNVFYHYVGDLRHRTAEKFMNWRSATIP
ncbi:Septin-domain-containing protein [Phlyctochytrium arcticum]|nr:Septin-domain-containing protein [Phlyctochytrium arcticum]